MHTCASSCVFIQPVGRTAPSGTGANARGASVRAAPWRGDRGVLALVVTSASSAASSATVHALAPRSIGTIRLSQQPCSSSRSSPKFYEMQVASAVCMIDII